MKLFKKIFDHEYKELKRFEELAQQVLALDSEMSKLTPLELKAKTSEFKSRLSEGETLDDILVEAFAVVREAAYRVLGEKPYKVQVIGGICIHYGNIAEMKTGEGKTLTSTMPAYLNALSGDGVHVITVNEYLSERDANWMGQVYNYLDISVGVNKKDMSREEKREAYSKDITYTTNNELGFDYLRDNMVVRKEDRVQRKLNFAIIDEVDSILIDEARTPLIISGGVSKSADLYKLADKTAKSLRSEDYNLDEKTRGVTLTEEGIKKCEKLLNVDNLYDISNAGLVHNLDKALVANYGFKKDVDYVVQNDQIIIVDSFTGRLMHGRQYSDGLHQALEAKEGVKINEETKVLATITFQNLFRMYNKLSGMTGTAKTEEEEFRNIYNMYVIEIPTNVPVKRVDMEDLVYVNMRGKFNALANTIEEIHKTGQPILVGTASIESSERLSDLLNKRGIKHELLNAKNHEREAHIIENAGQKGAVTIATNMAGRGTDIKLGEGVKELGGLVVLGSERHESRRIDNQLRGRAGRQGDPGTTRFYISMEDDLRVKFGSEKIKGLMMSLGFTEDTPIHTSSPYSSSKAGADLLVMAYYRTFGLPVTISRCSNNYGPYHFPEKLIPVVISKALNNEPIPVYGKGENVRDWIHVKDHNIGVDLIVRNGRVGEVYNLGGHSEKTNLEVVTTILNQMNKPLDLITFVTDRPGHDLRYAIDSSKVEKELNWSRTYNFNDGIKETVDWYLNNQSWIEDIKSGNYKNSYKQF